MTLPRAEGVQVIMNVMALAERRGYHNISNVLWNYQQRRETGMINFIHYSDEYVTASLNRLHDQIGVSEVVRDILNSFRDPWYPYFMDLEALESDCEDWNLHYHHNRVAPPSEIDETQLVAPVLLTKLQVFQSGLLSGCIQSFTW
jgi:hypothetical protein